MVIYVENFVIKNSVHLVKNGYFVLLILTNIRMNSEITGEEPTIVLSRQKPAQNIEPIWTRFFFYPNPHAQHKFCNAAFISDLHSGHYFKRNQTRLNLFGLQIFLDLIFLDHKFGFTNFKQNFCLTRTVFDLKCFWNPNFFLGIFQ